MKLFNSVLLIVAAALLAACGSEDATTAGGQETALEHAAKHLEPTYICPMHPQIVQNEPGSCPICGMDLVLKEAEQSDSSEKKILYYRHPHNPAITSDKPMQDEMGMDYVPVYDDGGGTQVKINPTVENNLGVRTAVAERDTLWRKIDTVGYVDYDENRISHIHLRTQGWIEKLYVKSEGERIQKDQLLFEYYSPEMVTAQEEYLQALNSGHKGLLRASRERLVALGVAEQQIGELNKTRQISQYIKVYAQQDGIIAQLNVRQGMFVMPQAEVMVLADLSTVWLLAEIFESQVDWVKVGQPADVSLSYYPGKQWEGKVQYVYPSMDPKTRTLKVRLQFDNPGEVLKPNMFADVHIYGGPRRDIIVIPREALIRTGNAQRVILAMGEGRYQARNVVAGMESGDWVEVVKGLQAGDKVVTSGQFLIDSEASLKASLQRMSSGEPETIVVKKIIGTGVLRELHPDEHKLNMTHDPIPALGWPDMTMPFDVRDDVDLSGFKPDQPVEFELEETDAGYVIKAMRPRAEMTGHD